jgi:hypothetical protein
LIAALLGVCFGFWASQIPEDFSAYLKSFLPADHSAIALKNARVQSALPLLPLQPPESPREVYPYSLVPGGVRSAAELRAVFERDPVLASHYRDFDFRHARLMRLAADETVYVSYRIAGKIYWTTRQVRLHAGEMVITDGVITVRTRCGNQVSIAPRTEVSPQQEPNVAVLERPMKFFDPPGVIPPAPNMFMSSMRQPSFPAFVTPPASFPTVNSPAFGFVFPPTPGTCTPFPPKRKPVHGGPVPGGTTKHKKNGNPCSPGGGGTPGEAPEPTSLLLLATGVGGILMRYRSHRRPSSTPLLAK